MANERGPREDRSILSEERRKARVRNAKYRVVSVTRPSQIHRVEHVIEKGQAIFRVAVCGNRMLFRLANDDDSHRKECRFCANGIVPDEAQGLIDDLV